MPDDAKQAKAEAKIAKAKAKALRPWYLKKRWWSAGVILVILIAAIGSSSGNKSSPASKTSPSSLRAASGLASICQSSPPAYPDDQPKDCVAGTGGQVQLLGYQVTATGWRRTTSNFEGADICANVTVHNLASGTLDYNALEFHLQAPSGSVADEDMFGSKSDIGSGQLVAGGSTNGQVCFSDPGQHGTYVGIFKPDPFHADRGIWLVPLS